MDPVRIVELVGVYDADHTIIGELTYFVNARLGREHCSLCDITHGLVREKRSWQRCRDALGVPFTTFHRDDQPDDIRAATEPPVVAARLTDGRVITLADGTALESCAGSPEQLVDLLVEAARAAGVVLD